MSAKGTETGEDRCCRSLLHLSPFLWRSFLVLVPLTLACALTVALTKRNLKIPPPFFRSLTLVQFCYLKGAQESTLMGGRGEYLI